MVQQFITIKSQTSDFFRSQGEVRDLGDNRLGDNCMYVISVETGYKMGAGTNAHVQFVLSGTISDTGVRNLAGTEAVPVSVARKGVIILESFFYSSTYSFIYESAIYLIAINPYSKTLLYRNKLTSKSFTNNTG